MKPEFWNQRFSEKEPVYGLAPNAFLASQLPALSPGRILFPGEGQGRNSVFAASLGWEVMAYDFSETAQRQALAYAALQGVSISYELESYENLSPTPASFDAVVLLYTHMHPAIRPAFHQRMAEGLKPGGTLILEGFHKTQLPLSSGGPKSEPMLYSVEEMEAEFGQWLNFEYLTHESVVLDEGPYHQGPAELVRLIGTRKA